MRTYYVIGGIAAAAIIAGGAYYMTSGSDTASRAGNEPAAAGAFEGTFSGLAQRGGNWKCTVDSTTAQADSSGVVYVSGDRIKGEFKSAVQGYGPVEGFLLFRDGDAYTWSSVLPQGIKTRATIDAATGAAPAGQAIDANMSYSYDCQPWTPDAAVFEVPSDVTFSQYGA